MSMQKPTSAEIKAATLILAAAGKKTTTKAKTKAKSKQVKARGLDAFKTWVDKRGYEISSVKPMSYVKADKTKHKGHVALMQNGTKMLVFESIFRSEANCKGLTWKED